MRASSDLVEWSGELNRALLDFAGRPRFARPFRQAVERRFGGKAAVDGAGFANFLDTCVLQHRLPDGRTLVEYFAEGRKEGQIGPDGGSIASDPTVAGSVGGGRQDPTASSAGYEA